jgi:molecular chaperone Hsp33
MTTRPDYDQLQRFLFEDTPIRGNMVHLDTTYQIALQHRDYPERLKQLLGEMMAAASLLASTLKLGDGTLILQIQGCGAIHLMVVECNSHLEMRATATWKGDINHQTFKDLVGDGHFVITLDPKDGKHPYQGIVPIVGDNISDALEHYMQTSEQIDTRIWLAADLQQAAGMLIQKLPEETYGDIDAWDRVGHLAATLSVDELLNLPTNVILTRLFHEETVRLFEAQATHFKCSCSRQNVANMLKMLGIEEVKDILKEQSVIETTCNFCHASYPFDEIDIQELFRAEVATPSSKTRH